MQRKKNDFYTSLVTSHNACRVLSKILNVNFDQLQIPHNEQRNMNTVGNNLNSAQREGGYSKIDKTFWNSHIIISYDLARLNKYLGFQIIQ